MIDCPNAEVRDLLPDFAHDRGRLSAETRVAVESHLATCPSCREELALLENVRRAYARVPAVDAERVVASLPRPMPSGAPAAGRARGRPASLWTWQRIAAVALVAVGAATIWLALDRLDPGSSPVRVDSTLASSATATPSPAMPLGHELSDLSDQELEALLGALDDLEALPALDPEPMIEPLGGEEGT